MRLGKMTKKQFLEPSYNSDKSVPICGFAQNQRSILQSIVWCHANLLEQKTGI